MTSRTAKEWRLRVTECWRGSLSDAERGLIADLDACEKERDEALGLFEGAIDGERKAEAERDEALRDVKQLHDAAVETEDKLDALKAEVWGYKNAYEMQKAHNLREGELAREVREVLTAALDHGHLALATKEKLRTALAKMGGQP